MTRDPAFRPLRRLARSQDGFALILALACITVLGITGGTVAYYSTSNYAAANHSKQEVTALSLAEAGLNMAFSRLHSSSSPTMSSALPNVALPEIPMDGGWTTYYGTLGADGVWHLTGIGHTHNPSGGADIYRTVTGRAIIGGTRSIWNYVFADATFGCTTIAQSVNINVPFYVSGNLCMANSASVTSYTLEVGGTVTMNSGQNTIGTFSQPLTGGIHIAGGCSPDGGGHYDPICGSADRVYGNPAPDNRPIGLDKPPLDLAGDYATAGPGMMRGCTVGSFPPLFDTDTTVGNTTRTVDIAPNNAPYSCKTYDANGQLVGELTWDGAGNLTIAGTIFIDGNILFKNLNSVVYHGRATIIASGKISVENHTTICGVSGCGSNWDNTANLLAFVAGSQCTNGNAETDSVSIDNYSTFQGAIYANCDYSEGNNVTVWGPIVARQLYIQNSTTNFYVPIGVPLPGMPNEIVNDPGSWGG